MTTSNDGGARAVGLGTHDVLGTTGAGTGASEARAKGQQVAGDAKEQAQAVAGTAKEQASHVAGSAQEQAQNVLAEAKGQAGDLLDDLRRQLAEQSDMVRDRLSELLAGVGSELDEMADSTSTPGYATGLVRQVSGRATALGVALQDSASGDLLAQTRAYARRKPGTFLLGALAAGVLAGRFSRGAKAHHDVQTSAPVYPAQTRPAIPATPVTPDPYAGTLGTNTLGGLESGTRPTEPYAGSWAPVTDDATEYRR